MAGPMQAAANNLAMLLLRRRLSLTLGMFIALFMLFMAGCEVEREPTVADPDRTTSPHDAHPQ